MKIKAALSLFAGGLRRAGSSLFGHDRWVHTLAFLVAAGVHIPLLIMGSRQYLQAASAPESANQAAQRVQAMQNDQGKPIHFVYVDDVKPPDTPDHQSPAASDQSRVGASPDPRKGDSPDPTSMGSSATRRMGGPGEPTQARPAVPPSAASPPAPKEVQQRGREFDPNESPRPSVEKQIARAAQETHGAAKAVQGQPVKSESGLPLGGEKEGGSKPAQQPASPPIQRGRPGLNTQLQEMSAGALAGGFNNPNASRLNTGDLSFDTAAWDLGPYARKVQERVQSNWRTPEAQTILRQKGWVAIRFNIQQDGRVTDLQVVRPSGIPSYDQSAMDALRSSNPLPPLPSEVTAPRLSAVFRFFYNMEEQK